MGHFSNEDLIRSEYDREEINPFMNKEQWINIILQAFPKKEYSELVNVNENTLKGMYAQACKKLKLQAYREHNHQNEDALPIFDEEDEERRLGR